jgi:hypothetical protein
VHLDDLQVARGVRSVHVRAARDGPSVGSERALVGGGWDVARRQTRACTQRLWYENHLPRVRLIEVD